MGESISPSSFIVNPNPYEWRAEQSMKAIRIDSELSINVSREESPLKTLKDVKVIRPPPKKIVIEKQILPEFPGSFNHLKMEGGKYINYPVVSLRRGMNNRSGSVVCVP